MKDDKKRPNILHFFVDQMRFDGIHALGNALIRTPALDSLVSKGTTFSNAFSPCPVCIPARGSMIYGQYPHHTGCYENGNVMPTDGRHSFMQVLTDSGYKTYGIGKCHFNPDPLEMRGFQNREKQEEIPKRPEDDDYLQYLFENGFTHILDPQGVRGDMYYIPQVSQIPQEYHPTQWIGDRTIHYIESNATDDNPWYLFSSFIHPHPPFAPPSPWYKLYGLDEVPLPNIPMQYERLLTYVNRAQNRYKYRDQGIDMNLIRLIRAYYFSCISFIDFQISRVLKVLRETGQDKNTMIIFTSDHGEYLGDYACFGKRGMHDVSSRIPLIIYQPRVFDDQKKINHPVSLVDLAPTILYASRSNYEQTPTHALDGIPLQFVKDNKSDREYVFSQLAFTQDADGTYCNTFFSRADAIEEERAASSIYMAVSKDFKYIYSAPDSAEFLFDRALDPLETRNRAHAPHFCEITKNVRSVLMEHLKKGGETGGIDNDNWMHFKNKELPLDPDFGLLKQDQPWVNFSITGYNRNQNLQRQD